MGLVGFENAEPMHSWYGNFSRVGIAVIVASLELSFRRFVLKAQGARKNFPLPQVGGPSLITARSW